jgi:NAD(P)-dependent dehydrogenase (short-subunit alcohol dehydrogenase family)
MLLTAAGHLMILFLCVLGQSAKAAALQFYETLRVEVGETIGITIVMPGWIESEMTRGKFVGAEGELTEKPVHQRDVSGSYMIYHMLKSLFKCLV